jgi:hypothetical protein
MKKKYYLLGIFICIMVLLSNFVFISHSVENDIAFQFQKVEAKIVQGYQMEVSNLCLVCTPTSGSCEVSDQCCLSQQPYCN